MKGIFTLALMLLLCSFTTIIAQNCDPLSPPDEPAAGCACAFPDCDFGLNGFMGTLGTLNTTQPFPGCGNNILNNDDWIAFIAGSTSISITLNISNCQGSGQNGGTGVQAAFYGGCSDPVNGTDEGLASDPLDTQCGCTQAPINLNYNDFVVGQTYYIVIDGCGGDICDYSISVNSGSTTVPDPGDFTAINGPSVVCPGATATYTTDMLFGVVEYDWIVTGGNIVSENENQITITWNTSGSISVSGSNACFDVAPIDFPVTVQPLTPLTAEGEYCDDEAGYIYPANGQLYTQGFHAIDETITSGPNAGCTQTTNLTVDLNPTYFIDVARTICEGESVEIGGIPYTQQGTYNINLVTQFTNCDSTIFLDLTVLNPQAIIMDPPDLGCTANQVTINGALSSGDQYVWSTVDGFICAGQGTPVLTACGIGTYCLEVTTFGVDGQSGQPVNCTDEMCVTINEDSNAPTLSASGTNVSCGGDTDGTATVTVTTGGVAPFIYIWSTNPLQSGPTAIDLEAGNYMVTVTGANGCTEVASVLIEEPSPIVLDMSSLAAGCAGAMTGSATVTPSGGSPGYTYLWNDPLGQSTQTATSLAAGTYIVTVTDANDCTNEETVDVGDAAAMSVTVSGLDIACNAGTTGTATATGGGGTGVYTYQWNDANSQTTQTATGLGAGDYTVVIEDENGCTATEDISLTEAAAIVLTPSSTDPGCSNSGDGEVSVVASGGMPGYTYLWNDPLAQATSTATGLDAGDYTVIVTDANDCTATEIISITAPNALSLSTSQTDVLCTSEETGVATVSASGGTPPLQYSWNDAASQNTPTATGLPAGTVTVVVTDDNGCTETIDVILTEPAEALSASGTSTDALCGQDDGTIDVTVTGGTTPYDYDWNGAAGNEQDPSNLGPGSYTVIVTDGNGCTTSTSVTVNSPNSPSVDDVVITNVNCNGETNGVMDITVSGGTGAYTFAWDPSSNDGNEDLSGVGAGSYSVTITDAVGCTVEANGVIPEPDLLEATATGSPTDCDVPSGNVSVVVSGGEGPYDFDWSDDAYDGEQSPSGLAAGIYTVIITDVNGCTVEASDEVITPDGPTTSITGEDVGCNGEETGEIDLTITGGEAPYDIDWGDPNLNGTEDPEDLPAGIYNVVVTDVNGCESVASIEIEEALLLEATISTTPLSCFEEDDGTVTVVPTGGTAPYTYLWNDGQETPTAIDCPAGQAVVDVTDANDCTIQLTINVDSPTELVVAADPENVDCNGSSTGSIEVTASGGTGPYSYEWTNGIPTDTEDPGALSANSYDLIVTDANGCTETVTNILIEEPDAMSASAVATQTDCGDETGTMTVTVSGGTGNYTYDWPDTANDGDQNPTDLAAGIYEVTITDANGCTITASDEVTTPAGPTMSIVGTDVGCNGEETGTVDITINGGAMPYDIDWGDAALNGNANLTDLPAGIYNVLVTDDNNCETTASYEVLEATLLEATISSTPLSCFEQNDGTVTVIVTGGTAPYTYAWNDGQTTPTAIDCPAGDAVVDVTDANNCTIQLTVTVDSPTQLVVGAMPANVDCNGSSTGSIEVTASGGTAPYSYAWTNGIPADTEDPGTLPANTYEVTITDANGCTEIITDILITEPEALSASATASPTDCGVNTGSIAVTVSGGTGLYTYDWPDTANDGEQNPTDLAAGDYEVTISDENGCTILASAAVITPAGPTTSIVGTDIGCTGEESGTIAITITGGAAPYDIDWGDPNLNGNENLIDLPAGMYNVLVTDANNCTSPASLELLEPAAALSLSSTSTDATCNQTNGTIDLTVTGGTAPYSYDWSGAAMDIEDPQNLGSGSYNVTVTDDNGCTAVQTQPVDTPSGLAGTIDSSEDANCFGESNGSIDLNVVGGTGAGTYSYEWDDALSQIIEDPQGLPAGDYNVIVTDGDGCTITVSATINQPAILTAAATSDEASCNAANGSIDLTVEGGVEPYSYDWSGAAMDIEDPQGLLSGPYDVIVTDANGCTTTTSITVTEPDALALTTTPSDVDCNGASTGSVNLEVTGGTGAGTYTYQWDDALTQEIEDAESLAAGDYNVVVTDGNGCTITTMITINEPSVIVASGTSTDATCNESNGNIDLTVSGGTAPYTYDWTGISDIEDPQGVQAGSYNVTITDDNGCTQTTSVTVNTPDNLAALVTPSDANCNGEASGSIEVEISGGASPYTVVWGVLGTIEDPQDVAAGDYTGIIIDANNCQLQIAATVGEPSLITASSTSIDATCNASNGSIDLTVVGGIAPYTYQWDGGADPIEDPQGITAGNYNVTITDANDCTLIYATDVSTPSALMLSTTSEDASCNGDTDGSIDLTVSGGNAPFNYDWSQGPDTEDQDNLGAAVYTVTVTDNDGCTITASVTINEPDVLVAVNNAPSNVSCNGGNDGSATIVVTGGTGPYNYDWSDNSFDGEDAPSSMSSGSYTVTVTDDNGCTTTEDVQIDEPNAIQLSTDPAPALCFGGSEGSIDLTINGGTSPYSYSWNGGLYTDEDPQNIPAGNYTVVVTDDNGCTQTTSVQVSQPTALLVNIDNVSNYGGTNVSCSDAEDGSAQAVGLGGTAPYSYAWSTGVTTADIENLGSGTYQVIVTDANGCSSENEVNLSAPTGVGSSLQVINPECFGENDGVIQVEGTGGNAPYVYAIDGSAFSPVNQFAGLVSGNYEIQIQDVNGCEQLTEAQVVDPIELQVDLGDDIEIQMGDSVRLDPISNVPQFALDTFIWRSNLEDYNPWVKPLETTQYQITVINEFGCVDEDLIQVRVRKDRLIYIPNIFTPNDDGFNDLFMINGGRGVDEVETFRVFNRWGELVYEGYNFQPNDPNFSWDGKFRGEVVNPAVFVYYAKVKFIDGRSEVYKGDVSLMR